MANVLSCEDQIHVLRLLVEGNSLRSVTRITGVHRTTVMKLLVMFGEKCRAFLDCTQRNLTLRHVEADEIWTFCRKKQGRLTAEEKSDTTIGDQYLYVAQDQDSKLIVTYAIGKRNSEVTEAFIDDLASRMAMAEPSARWEDKPQISTDGWHAYPPAVLGAFGSRANYGQLIKAYNNTEQPGRYGPPTMVDTERRRIIGTDNLYKLCTSHVERNNLTIRTFMKRFTRLSLGFSKKLENLGAAVALHVAYFNYCWRSRENKGGRYRLTAAMQAGITNELWTMDRLYDEVMGAVESGVQPN